MIAGQYNIYAMNCDLAADSADDCVMKSPQNVPNATVSTPCMVVYYGLSSDDVVLTADVFVAGVTKRVTFTSDREIRFISLSDLPSMLFTVNFTAKRVLTSVPKTQSARIDEVRLGQCASEGV